MLTRLAAVLTALLLLASAPAPAGEGKPAARFKLATVAPRGSVYHQILLSLKEKWAAAPGGGVDLVIFPDGNQGGEPDMVRKMRIGQLQAALMTASGLAEIEDSVNALQNMPMLFRDLAEVEKVRVVLRPMIEKKFEEKGFVLLSLEDAGWVKFFATQSLTTPDDLRKCKLFALSSDAKALEIWRAAGFTPVPMDTIDIVTGLTTKRIDVVPAPATWANAMQISGIAKHMLDLNWAPLVGGLVVKKDAWEKVPEEVRTALRESAVAAGRDLMARTRAENDEAVEAMKKRGLTVLPVPAEVQAEWASTAEKAYPMIRGKIVPADLFDQVQEILKEARK